MQEMGVFHIGMGFFSAHAMEFPLQATRCAVPFIQSAALRFDGQDPWILERSVIHNKSNSDIVICNGIMGYHIVISYSDKI